MGGLWYYRRSGQQTGPVPFDELRRLSASGSLTPDDEVRSGHGYWQQARTVDELWSDLALSVSDGMEERAAKSSPPSHAAFADSDDLMGDLDLASLDDALPVGTDVDRQFFCRRSGEKSEIGPFALAEVQAEADAGRLKPNDRIREDGSLCWIPCRELGGLRFADTATLESDTLADLPYGAAEEPEEAAWQDDSAGPDQSDADEADGADNWEDVLYAPQEEEEEAVEDEPAEAPPQAAARRAPAPQTSAVAAAASAAAEAMMASVIEDDAPKTSKKSKRIRARRQFRPGMLNSPLFYVLGGLLVVFAVYKMWPSHGDVYGQVLIDGAPLPTGSLTVHPHGKPRDGFSLRVIDGAFSSADLESLAPGRYEVAVTIGNPLGAETPKLNETPALAALNGARLTTTIELGSGETDAILLELDSSDAVLLNNENSSITDFE